MGKKMRMYRREGQPIEQYSIDAKECDNNVYPRNTRTSVDILLLIMIISAVYIVIFVLFFVFTLPVCVKYILFQSNIVVARYLFNFVCTLDLFNFFFLHFTVKIIKQD